MKLRTFLFLTLVPSTVSWARVHPGLLNTRSDWTAMIASSTVHPWSDVLSGATMYMSGTNYSGYSCANMPTNFGTGSDSIRQQNENGFMNVIGADTLLYVLHTNDSGSITYRNKILCEMNLWPKLQADQPVPAAGVSDYNWSVPLNGAFMSMTIALDEIHDDLTSVQISSYEVMMDSYVAASRNVTSSWHLSNDGAYLTYDLYRSTDAFQLAADTDCYHVELIGNDVIYPPAVCDARQSYSDLSSEIAPGTQLNSAGLSGSLGSYSWERIGGEAREKEGKWGGKEVLAFNGLGGIHDATVHSSTPPLTNFFEWQFAANATPWNAKIPFGDTANNQLIGKDDYQGLQATYGHAISPLPGTFLVVGKYSKRALGWANRARTVFGPPVTFPGELIDYTELNSTDVTPGAVASIVVPHGGAAFWDDDQSSNTLQGVLLNMHFTKGDHYHQPDVNNLVLDGYGNFLISNVGTEGSVQTGVNGFPWVWHHEDAHSGNVLLMGNTNYANNPVLDTGQAHYANSYWNWNPFATGLPYGNSPYVGNGAATPLYGGDGITESILGTKFDYAVGLSSAPYLWYDMNTGALTYNYGRNNRDLFLVHSDSTTGVNGYFVVVDEAYSPIQTTVNQIWHPFGTSFSTGTLNQEYSWPITHQLETSTNTLTIFLASPPQSIAASSSPFAGTPSFTGTYINGTYAVTASSAHVMTVLYPSTTAVHKATFTRISDGEAQGATILSGSTTDYFMASNGSNTVTMGGATFRGKVAYMRKNATTRQFFVRQGTAFNDGSTPRYGFDSTAPISLHVSGKTGTVTSPTAATVTAYYLNLSEVDVDGAAASGSAGTDSFAFSLSSGSHVLAFVDNGVPVVPARGHEVWE